MGQEEDVMLLLGLESQEQEGEESHASDEALGGDDQCVHLVKQIMKSFLVINLVYTHFLLTLTLPRSYRRSNGYSI